MKAGDMILGYRLVTNGTASAGRSLWAFAQKDGKNYFVKQFLSPKYPVEGAPGSLSKKQEALRRCEKFEDSQRRIIDAIRYKVASGGSIVAPVGFGRVGPIYYKIYDRIDVTNFSPLEISGMAPDQKQLILRVVAHSVSILHKEGIVHGDLKPDNILIKRTETGAYTAKLIDFDDSYFEGHPPEDPEAVVGDQVYYSPELLEYILSGGPANRSRVTCKSDIFAMGLIFSQYWTGKLPRYDTARSLYPASAVVEGQKLLVDSRTMPGSIVALIQRMLSRSPAERPTAQEILAELKAERLRPSESEEAASLPERASRLKGKRLLGSLPRERSGPAADSAEGAASPAPPRPPGSRIIRKPKP